MTQKTGKFSVANEKSAVTEQMSLLQGRSFQIRGPATGKARLLTIKRKCSFAARRSVPDGIISSVLRVGNLCMPVLGLYSTSNRSHLPNLALKRFSL
jgi:hypothetical protein